MVDETERTPARTWWARGLLFENCSCQVVCPGHVHFSQKCTLERCVGYWAVDFREGDFGGVPLAGLRGVVAYDSPQHMIEGGWTEVLVIDPAATSEQRDAVESILSGRAGGPWAVLARFVGRRLPTLYRPVRLDDEGPVKRVTIEGVLRSTIKAIRGRDRERPVTFRNMFNQIHAATQVIARGSARYDGEGLSFDNEGTHGLYSDFDWSVRGD